MTATAIAVRTRRGRGVDAGNATLGPLLHRVNRLTLTAPYFAFAQHALENFERSDIPLHVKEDLRKTASKFNGLIRRAAEVNPNLSVQGVTSHLVATVGLAIPNQQINQEAPEAIRGCERKRKKTSHGAKRRVAAAAPDRGR